MNGKIKDGTLVLELPLQKPKVSKSGKTLIVASSRGVQRLAAKLGGKNVCVTVNAFIYPDPAAEDDEETIVPQRKGRKTVTTPTGGSSRPDEHREEDAVHDDEEDEDGY